MKCDEELLPCPNEPEAFAFNVGDLVSKPSGYAFDGAVRSAFHNEDGFARYVVEHTANRGMLHIFSRKQLAARTPSPSGAPEGIVVRRIAAARMVLGMSTLQTRFADRDGEWSLSDLFNAIESALRSQGRGEGE